jgi:hypothetical protein
MSSLAYAQVAPNKFLFSTIAPKPDHLLGRTWQVTTPQFEPEISRGDYVALDTKIPESGDIVAIQADNNLGFRLGFFEPGMDVLARVASVHRIYR